MKVMMLSLLLCSFALHADDEVIEVPTPASLPAPELSGHQISPEQAKAMLEKLKAGQKMREDQNKMMEELDREE